MAEQTIDTAVEASISVKIIRADGSIEEFIVPAKIEEPWQQS